MAPPLVILNPTLSIQFTGQAVAGGPANIITPGQDPYSATAFLYEAYFPAPSAGITLGFNPIGANFIPVVYLKNVDPTNLLLVNLFTVGLGNNFGFELAQGSYVFFYNPIAKNVGAGVGGIDSTGGLRVANVAASGTCACEIFLAI